MTSNTLTKALTIGLTLYQIPNDGILTAVLVPFVGCGLYKIGKYCNSEAVNNLGGAIILASAFAIPGSAVGSIIHTLGEKTIGAKVVSGIVGSVITDKVINATAAFIEKNMMRQATRSYTPQNPGQTSSRSHR